MLDNKPVSIIQSYPFGDDLVLFEPVSRRLYVLNYSGGYIWQLLQKYDDEHVIAAECAEHFSITPQQAHHELSSCLAHWGEVGLLTGGDDIQPFPQMPNPFSFEICDTENVLRNRTFSYKKSFVLAGKKLVLSATSRKRLDHLSHPFQHLAQADPHRLPDIKVYVFEDMGQEIVIIGDKLMRTEVGADTSVDWLVAEFVDITYRQSDCLAVLHGGAIGRDQQAIIFAGASGSGKSTLIASLQATWGIYLSDDVCPLTAQDGMLVPVPMGQNIKEGSWQVVVRDFPELLRQTTVRRKKSSTKYLIPSTFDDETWLKPWPVGAIVFPAFQEGSSPTFSQIPPLNGLSTLMNSGSIYGDDISSLLKWIVNIPCYQITYPNLEAAHQILTEKIWSRSG